MIERRSPGFEDICQRHDISFKNFRTGCPARYSYAGRGRWCYSCHLKDGPRDKCPMTREQDCPAWQHVMRILS